jgi:hypothetical protein
MHLSTAAFFTSSALSRINLISSIEFPILGHHVVHETPLFGHPWMGVKYGGDHSSNDAVCPSVAASQRS